MFQAPVGTGESSKHEKCRVSNATVRSNKVATWVPSTEIGNACSERFNVADGRCFVAVANLSKSLWSNYFAPLAYPRSVSIIALPDGGPERQTSSQGACMCWSHAYSSCNVKRRNRSAVCEPTCLSSSRNWFQEQHEIIRASQAVIVMLSLSHKSVRLCLYVCEITSHHKAHCCVGFLDGFSVNDQPPSLYISAFTDQSSAVTRRSSILCVETTLVELDGELPQGQRTVVSIDSS